MIFSGFKLHETFVCGGGGQNFKNFEDSNTIYRPLKEELVIYKNVQFSHVVNNLNLYKHYKRTICLF
jgi:hypothetical protein